jgi:plasmid stabilization system protein ParE
MIVVLGRKARLEFDTIVEDLSLEPAGLADAFIDDFLATVDDLERYPRMYRETSDGIRRAILRRFSYVLYYVVGDLGVEIVEIAHSSRDRSEWEVHEPHLLMRFDRPNVPAEPHHMEAVLAELRAYRQDGERGRPGFEALESIRRAL